jgi:large subunit ribosomal protein L25
MQISVNEENPFPAIVADYSYHPLTRELLHVDFLHIDLDSPVDVDVPLVTSGKPAGVVEGGTLRQIFRKLPIRCLPALIPLHLEYDVTAMAINDVAKVGDLKLPEGIQVRLPVEQTVIAVDAAVAEPEAEVVPGAEGAEAAPAAEAATDAAKGKAEPAKGKAEPAKGK